MIFTYFFKKQIYSTIINCILTCVISLLICFNTEDYKQFKKIKVQLIGNSKEYDSFITFKKKATIVHLFFKTNKLYGS